MLQLVAVTDQLGYKLEVFDNNAFRLPIDAARQIIKKFAFDVVAIGGLITQYKYIKPLVPVCREEHPTALIVGGGGFMTSMPREMLRWLPDLDLGVIGEAYVTWPEILEHLDDQNWRRVKGVVYREGKKIKLSKMRPLIPEKKVDTDIPFPAYEFSPIETYIMNSMIPYSPEAMTPTTNVIEPRRRLDVLTSYGCPWKCTFCFHNGSTPYCQGQIYGKTVAGKPFRQHSPQYVVNLIQHLRLEYAINFVSFIDENLTVNRKWFMEFCDLLEVSGLGNRIHWGMVCHARTVDGQMLTKARSVGCSYVSYGGETSSEKLLKQMGKGQTKTQMVAAIEATHAAGMNPIMSFIVGFPDTTLDDLVEDAQFLVDYRIRTNPFFLQPYPGSKLYREHKEQIIHQHLTEDETAFLKENNPAPELFTKVFGTENPSALSKSKLKRRLPILHEEIRDTALQRWVSSLDDATKLSVNLTHFNNVELAGLRYMLFDWRVELLKKFRKTRLQEENLTYRV